MGNQAVRMTKQLTQQVKTRISEKVGFKSLLDAAQKLPEGVPENKYALSTMIDANEIVTMRTISRRQ